MIATLRGLLTAKAPGTVVVEAGGVGYRVCAPLTVTDRLPATGAEVFLLTELIVREDSQTLYGFLDERSRALFCRLMRVSGIGAKTALAMLSAMDADAMLSAIAKGDTVLLSSAPGIGEKTAQRLIVELRGEALSLGADVGGEQSDAAQALAALGYKKPEIQRALAAMRKSGEEYPTPAEEIRAALKILAKR